MQRDDINTSKIPTDLLQQNIKMTSFEHTNNLPLAGDILDDFAIIFRELLNKVKLKKKSTALMVQTVGSAVNTESNRMTFIIRSHGLQSMCFLYDKGESSTNQIRIIVFRRFGRLSTTNETNTITTKCFVVQHLIKVALFLR